MIAALWGSEDTKKGKYQGSPNVGCNLFMRMSQPTHTLGLLRLAIFFWLKGVAPMIVFNAIYVQALSLTNIGACSNNETEE